MADGDPLVHQVTDLRKRIYEEKLVNEQFEQLEGLEGVDDSPHFVEDVYDLYFADSAKYISSIEQEIAKHPLDRITLDKILHKLKGSSSSVGANLVLIATNRARAVVPEGTIESIRLAIGEIKMQHDLIRCRLETYFELRRQLLPEELEEMANNKDDGEHSEWDENDDE